MQAEPIDVDTVTTTLQNQREQSTDSDIIPLSAPPAHLVNQPSKPKKPVQETPELPCDAWEVAYTWAFIIKFDLLKDIKGLESVQDLEDGLLSWVPNDVLQNTLIAFLSNLRPLLANKLDSTSLERSLSKYINDQLANTDEFTVWDDPWLPDEKGRASCCHTDISEEERHSLGRLSHRGETARSKLNPIQGWEDGNGGLWNLKWHDRAKLLRQLVDWQLTYCGEIRETIKDHYRIKPQVNMNFDADTNNLIVDPLGQDRDKNRIWNFDGSARFYSSGNPFKRPSPLTAYTNTKDQVLAKIEHLRAYKNLVTPKEDAILACKRGKVNRAELKKAKKLVNDKEAEGKLADAMEALLPEIEKHEQKIARAQRKLHQAATMAALVETRGTRTRKQANKPDYVYDGDEEPRRGKRRYDDDAASDGSGAPSTSARAIIPGERRSTRVAAIGKIDTAPSSRNASRENSAVPVSAADSVESGSSKKHKSMKGYAWVDDGGLPPTDGHEASEKASSPSEAEEGTVKGDGEIVVPAPEQEADVRMTEPDDQMESVEELAESSEVQVVAPPPEAVPNVARPLEVVVNKVDGQNESIAA